MALEARIPFSIRLDPSAKRALSDAAERCETDASTVAREVLELVVQRVEAGGGDLRATLEEMRELWRDRVRADLERRLALRGKALAQFQSREDYEATCREISELATKLAEF
jgi:hypothetical protein